MKKWSSLISAVGLLFLFSLNRVWLFPEDLKAYCQLTNCPEKSVKPHYLCNNSENWSEACGKSPKLITITKKIKKHLVNGHNMFRDFVARGYTVLIPGAGRMYKLSWDRDLADVARLLVMRCDLRPTKSCISTLKFPSPGYNAVYAKFKNKQNAYRIVKTQMNAWFDEYKNLSPVSLIDGSSEKNAEVGHFLRMMVGPSNRIGCAIAASEKGDWNYQWLTCLYSCSPENNAPLYEFSRLPASLCVEGADSKYQNLCSHQEAVDSCNRPHVYTFPNVSDISSQIRGLVRSAKRPVPQNRYFCPFGAVCQPTYLYPAAGIPVAGIPMAQPIFYPMG